MARGISKTNFKAKINITIWLPGLVVTHLREDTENYSRYIEGLIYQDKPGWKREVEKSRKENDEQKK